MSKPIYLTDAVIAEMTNEFAKSIRNMKMCDGNVSYTKKFTYENDDPITLRFSPVAYIKMVMLLQDFTTEVAWHGVSRRTDDGFIITDILVYPQDVSGATVNTDQEGYQKWLIGIDDDIANHLHTQGHSHVNMGTTPSTVDLNHQDAIIRQLGNNDYYIFMIWNKSLNHTIKIYDITNNTLYEDGDIAIMVTGVDCDLDQFMKDAKGIVKMKSYATQNNWSSYGEYNGYHNAGNDAKVTSGDKKLSGSGKGRKKDKASEPPKLGSGWNNRGSIVDSVDYDEMIFGHRT